MSRKSHFSSFIACATSALIAACSSSGIESASISGQVEVAPTGRPTNNQKSDRGRADRIVAPGYDEIKRLYHQHADDFDRLASQLELDIEVTELYCDENMVAVTTPDETFYDGESDPYTSKYERLCRFTQKVAARRSTHGIRFPYSFFEVGALFVTSYLEKTDDTVDAYDKCGSSLIDEQVGACAISINRKWLATYEWRPFCLDYMKGEAGCK